MTPLDKIKSAVLGTPFDPEKKPSRTGIVQAFAEMQSQLEAAQSGAIVKATLASLQALPSVAYASIMAWVTNDSTMTNNGIYENTGTAAAPAWTRRASIPQFMITALNVGAGTSNVIRATTDLPIPTEDGRAFVALLITATNTGNVTVSFNSATALPVLTNSGQEIIPGGLIAGMIIIGVITQGKFRLISDLSSSTIQTAAAASAASAAASAADAASLNPTLGTNYVTRASAIAATIPVGVTYLRTAGYAAPGDGGDGLHVRVADSGDLLPSQFRSNANTVRWELRETCPRPEQFGAIGDNSANDAQSLVNCDSYCLIRGYQITLTRSYLVNANITINSPMNFGPVARINTASGRTVTINGALTVDKYQHIFQGLGTIAGTFGGNRVNPCWFGAKSDGTLPAQTATALQTAINLKKVSIPPGKFNWNAQIVIPATGVDIEADWFGTIMIYSGPDGTAAIRAFGQKVGGENILFSSAGPATQFGNSAVVVSSTGLNRGDWIYIVSEQVYDRNGIDGFGDNVKIGQILRVLRTNGGVVRFDRPLDFNYLTADNARIQKIALVDKIKIWGGRWYGASTDPDNDNGMGDNILQGGILIDHSCFQLVGCQKPEVDVSEMGNWHGLACDMTDSIGGRFRPRLLRNALGKIAYGFSYNNGSIDCYMEGAICENVRHAASQGTNGAAGISSIMGLYGITQLSGAKSCTALGSSGLGDAFNTHGAARNCFYDDTNSEGGVNAGVIMRGTGNRATNCKVKNPRQKGLYVGCEVRPEYQRPDVVTGNQIDNPRAQPTIFQVGNAVGFWQQGDEIIQGSARGFVVTYLDIAPSGNSGALYVDVTAGTFVQGPFTTAAPSTATGTISRALSISGATGTFTPGQPVTQGSATGTVVSVTNYGGGILFLHVQETSGTFDISGSPISQASPAASGNIVSFTAPIQPSAQATGIVLERLQRGATISTNTVDLDEASARGMFVGSCMNLIVQGNIFRSNDGTQCIWEGQAGPVGFTNSNWNSYLGNWFGREIGSGGAATTGLGANSTHANSTLRGFSTVT